MSKLDSIIKKASEHKIEMITCRGCKGAGRKDCYSHVRSGVCFRCNGSGKVMNKWGKIKKEAEDTILGIQDAVTSIESVTSPRIKENRTEAARRYFIYKITELCQRAGI